MRTALSFVICKVNAMYFKLLSERAVERATQALFNALSRDKLLDEFSERCKGYALDKSTQVMPGFNLFQQGSNRPLSWFLPKVKTSTVELLRIYERVASQSLSGIDTVAEIASHLYPRSSDERKLFMRFAHPDLWLSPALLFAAVAQYAGAEVEELHESSVRMRLGTGHIMIDRTGIWSNTRSAMMEFPEDSATGAPATTFPSIATNHPVVRSMYDYSEDYGMPHVATVVALALDEELLPKSFLTKLGRLEGSVIEKSKHSKHDPQKSARALDNCMEILDQAVYDVVPELFAVAVPDLMSFRRLQSIVGAPSQVRQNRKIKDETIENWRSKLRAVHQELADANA
jgi:hypothetical protein